MAIDNKSAAVTFTTTSLLNYALTLEYLEADMYRQAVGERQTSGARTAVIHEFGGQDSSTRHHLGDDHPRWAVSR